MTSRQLTLTIKDSEVLCRCGHAIDLEDCDAVGCCPGNVYCSSCGTEIDQLTGNPHEPGLCCLPLVRSDYLKTEYTAEEDVAWLEAWKAEISRVARKPTPCDRS